MQNNPNPKTRPSPNPNPSKPSVRVNIRVILPFCQFVPAFTLTGSVSMQQCCFFVVCFFEGD